jgi:hypothetical protein
MKNYKILTSRMTRAVRILLLGGMMAVTCSCDDFLTIAPTNKIVKEDFWKTKGDVESVLAESYRLMTTSDFLNRLIVWGELRSDNVIEGNFGGNNEIKYINEANILPNNSYARWDVFYRVINNCNIVLEYAPGVLDEDPDFTQGDLDVVCGEMYALRALCHFYLVRTFRDVPLMTEAMVNNSQNLKQAQAEPLVVLDACLDDLKKAEKLVLTSGNHRSTADNKGRVTKDAVRTMIADVLLWKAAFLKYDKKPEEAKACYTECAKYCDLVLDTRMKYILDYLADHAKYYENQKLELHETYPILYPRLEMSESKTRFAFRPYFEVFGASANSMCESIFEIQHTSQSSNANYEVPNFYGYGEGEGVFKVGLLSAPADVALEGKKGDSRIYQKSDFRRVTFVHSQSAADGTAPENYGIIKYSQQTQMEKRTGDGIDNEAFGTIEYVYHETNTSGGRYIEMPVNWIVYRISDVMLMKAEALAYRAEGTDLSEAYRLVEAVYNRSQSLGADGSLDRKFFLENTYPASSYVTSENMIKLVLEERQRELAYEGKRWYDLVRKALCDGTTEAMLDIVIPRKYESNPAAYRSKMVSMHSMFFPIAEREINTNDLLVQNPVYETENVYQQN